MSVVWSIMAGAIVFFFYRDRRLSIASGQVIFSHEVLDFIAHDPVAKLQVSARMPFPRSVSE